jgi:hypothetical protein
MRTTIDQSGITGSHPVVDAHTQQLRQRGRIGPHQQDHQSPELWQRDRLVTSSRRQKSQGAGDATSN